MNTFLDAALKVLAATDEPLTARRITEIAVSKGLLATEGKTPAQTMKSKLSTDILKKGRRSLFMRVEKGSFALRSWQDKHAEYRADRFQRALFDEDIVVFPSTLLNHFVPKTGLYAGEIDHNRLMSECRPMRRRLAEMDLTVIQLVSVFILCYRNLYLTHKRTRRLPESRLHGFYSLAFGGHLNPDDLRPLLNIFDPEVGFPLLFRELSEEVVLEPTQIKTLQYRGLLYDDSRPVSKQHLGVVYRVNLHSDQFEIGERGFLMDAKFETLTQIEARLGEFENWSVILLREELARCLK